MKKFHLIYFAILALSVIVLSGCDRIRSADDLFKEIEKKYQCDGVKNVKYSVSQTLFDENKVAEQNTLEYEYVFPGQHVLKMDNLNNEGLMNVTDTLYRFENGKIVSKRSQIPYRLFFSLDVYSYNYEEFQNRIKKFNFVDFSKFTKAEINDRKFYIIGIDKYKDTVSPENQVWYDAETLLINKLVVIDNNRGIIEIQFDNYLNLGKNRWIAQKLTYLLNSEIVFIEQNFDIREPMFEKKSLSIKDFSKSESLNEKRFDPNISFMFNYLLCDSIN